MQWVGLVRNVMVGRQGLHREVLLRLLAEAGGADGHSHLATGNLTFTASVRSRDGVVARLEQALAEVIGHPEPVIVRSRSAVTDLVAQHPFAALDPTEWAVTVTFVKDSLPPIPASVELAALVDDRVSCRSHELLVATPRTAQPAVWVTRAVERVTGARASTRAWSTVERLARWESPSRPQR